MLDSVAYNPLDKANLGRSVSDAVLTQPALPLHSLQPFVGAGVYALYYNGPFDPYAPLANANAATFKQPIYVGKAVPEGARRGVKSLDALSGNYLFKRLNEHKRSIEQVGNLSLDHFFCRYLVVDEIWIPLGESLLIQKYQPLWNSVLDGFGNHDPGRGRRFGKKPLWDILHPGRTWAEKLTQDVSAEEVQSCVGAYFKQHTLI